MLSSLHLFVVTPRSWVVHRALITSVFVVTPRTWVEFWTENGSSCGRLRGLTKIGESENVEVVLCIEFI